MELHTQMPFCWHWWNPFLKEDFTHVSTHRCSPSLSRTSSSPWRWTQVVHLFTSLPSGMWHCVDVSKINRKWLLPLILSLTPLPKLQPALPSYIHQWDRLAPSAQQSAPHALSSPRRRPAALKAYKCGTCSLCHMCGSYMLCRSCEFRERDGMKNWENQI